MSVCSSLQNGLGVHARYAKALAALARYASANTSLDFGSGLGLYSSFLAKTVKGLTDVCCVEPEPMINLYQGKLLNEVVEDGSPIREENINILEATPDDLKRHGLHGRFDIVHANHVLHTMSED